RALVHAANPEIQETIKWGMPFYEYKRPCCSMASFKKHVAFGFWKASLLNDPDGHLGELSAQGGDAMGNLGRIESLADLPSDDILSEFIEQACKLNVDKIKLPAKPIAEKKPLVTPDYFIEALLANPKANATFEAFSSSQKKEYVDWVTEAKTEKTRLERLATAVEWMSEGKIRLWKYVKS
ncbi:MAG: YdeI/OmpD-associated family protein, partial [Saprospiraceae bacterium]